MAAPGARLKWPPSPGSVALYRQYWAILGDYCPHTFTHTFTAILAMKYNLFF